MTRSQKGNYYRLRTKKWLQKKGFKVETLERIKRYVDKKGVMRFAKSDLWGADLIAANKEQMIFVNSVFGRSHISPHIKEFLKYPYPLFVELWVVVWEKGAREPEIIEAR